MTLSLFSAIESETEMNIGGKLTTTKTTTSYYDYDAEIKLERPL